MATNIWWHNCFEGWRMGQCVGENKIIEQMAAPLVITTLKATG